MCLLNSEAEEKEAWGRFSSRSAMQDIAQIDAIVRADRLGLVSNGTADQ